VVEAVHAVGGRVAVHAQHEAGARNAVVAGVDSLEHGMCLDSALLEVMRDNNTVLVPTLSVLTADLDQVRSRPRTARRDWYLTGAERHHALTAAAHEAGVLVLAGSDSRPLGRIADEIRSLAAAGVPVTAALAAASWSARTFLGLGELTAGAVADAVVYDADPRHDLAILDHPRWVIRAGLVLRHRTGPVTQAGERAAPHDLGAGPGRGRRRR
jgi:imidazolonepropionase-like amidohydrolase